MKKLLLLILLFSVAGCTTIKGMQTSTLSRYDASRKLSSAQKEMERGRTGAAIPLLEEVIAAPGIDGVTDEALFRLSLLKIASEDKDGTLPSLRYLERLRHEYQESIWTQQSKPLLEFLRGIAEIRKQNRTLKSSNSSLSKENKELHQSIERLKNLDLQLERKAH
jgi:hypothetical protein